MDLEVALEASEEEARRRFWDLADSHSVGPKTAAGIALTNALQLGQGDCFRGLPRAALGAD